jgi:hypothetical protein
LMGDGRETSRAGSGWLLLPHISKAWIGAHLASSTTPCMIDEHSNSTGYSCVCLLPDGTFELRDCHMMPC